MNDYRDTWVEVDLQAIADNIRTFQQNLSRDTKIMAVVKSNGYGHGAIAVAKKALEQGVYGVGVAFLGEALELREAGFDAPILVMGYTAPDYVEVAVEHDVQVTVYHDEVLDALEQAACRLGKTALVHVKVDTGMGRIGVRDAEALRRMIRKVVQSQHLKWEGIFTHYATADEEDSPLLKEQMDRFATLLKQLEHEFTLPPMIHTSNTAAAMVNPSDSYSLVRLGIGMYGQYPSPFLKQRGNLQLQASFSLKTRIAHVKELASGETISYGATYTTDKEERIATIPIGYGDGYPRQLSNKGEVLVHGKRAPIVGRICMDQLMINVTDIPEASLGDEVVLIGKQGDEQISADEVANWLDTINYEVTCMIGARVPRVYVE